MYNVQALSLPPQYNRLVFFMFMLIGYLGILIESRFGTSRFNANQSQFDILVELI